MPILDAAKNIGHRGAIAVDLDWSQQKKAFPNNQGPTSISILVDKDGIIRLRFTLARTIFLLTRRRRPSRMRTIA